MTHRFQHPIVLSIEHRPFTPLDYSIPKTPFRDVLGDYAEISDGSGWTALVVIDGRLHRVRGGGRELGPRSTKLRGEAPGVYARDEENGDLFELLPKASSDESTPLRKSSPCTLDAIDLIPFGRPVEDAVPGWDGWGDEPDLSETTCAPDPMEPQP